MERTHTDPSTRDSLRWIADRLIHHRPHLLMTDDMRLAVALSAAHTAHPSGDQAAENLQDALLHRMPYVDKPITCGGYALLLHKISWSAS
jgi:hypothetical protein